jgi:hypothetical protein
LPAKLNYLGGNSFWNTNLTVTKLPEGLTTIRTYSFTGSNINIPVFGTPTSPIKELQKQALDGAGDDSISELTIYCAGSGAIKPGAFDGYKVKVSKLYIHSNGDDIDDAEIAGWNINCTHNTTITIECANEHRNGG